MAAKNAAAGKMSGPENTLFAAKPKLKDALEKILYAAYFNAEMESLGSAGEETSIFSMVQNNMEKVVEKKAKKFSQDVAEPLAESIYQFVLSLQITVQGMPFISPSGVSGGPCTGVADTNMGTIGML